MSPSVYFLPSFLVFSSRAQSSKNALTDGFSLLPPTGLNDGSATSPSPPRNSKSPSPISSPSSLALDPVSGTDSRSSRSKRFSSRSFENWFVQPLSLTLRTELIPLSLFSSLRQNFRHIDPVPVYERKSSLVQRPRIVGRESEGYQMLLRVQPYVDSEASSS